jgi:inorganic pyrophosphatase
MTEFIDAIPSVAADGLTHVIIDTPKGSRNKYKYDSQLRNFKISRVLPLGMCFPHDFGFIPSTAGADGDPLDVLVLVETPSFVGCLMQVQLIGVICAEQIEGEQTVRNDRLIAVVETPVNKPVINDLHEVPSAALAELEQFFSNYNRAQGRAFKVLGRGGPATAKSLLEDGMRVYREQRASL